MINWANKWNIPPEALQELYAILTNVSDEYVGKSEAYAQQQIRLDAPKHGVYLFRNNRGACYDESGRLVRYGLANDSKQQDERIKSSDLIGVTPVTVTPVMLGTKLGIFTSYEVKKPGWRFTGTKRENAQLKWLNLIVSLGGIGKFTTGPGDIWQ